jgi:ABC-type Fe3+ transport system substrate-binding protein
VFVRFTQAAARASTCLLVLVLAACSSAAPAAQPTSAPPAAKPTTPPAAAQPAAAAQPTSAPVLAEPTGAPSSDLQALIEAAKKETVLKASWSSTGFGGGPGFEDFVAGMNKKFGLNIKPQFTPGIDQQAMMARITQEAAAGQPATSDIYLGNAPAAFDAQKSHVLRPVNWNAMLDKPLPKEDGFDPISPDSSAVAFASTLVGVTYNSDLVKGADVPHKMQDLMNPKWKGKIASTPYAAGFREFASDSILGRERVIDFVKGYTAQVGGLIRCGEPDRLTSGEFLMLAMDCGGEDATIGKQKGQPLDQVILDDATLVHTRYGGVPVNSAAPNSATLLIVYLLSPEGQAALWKWNAIDLHLFPDAHTKAMVDKVKTAGGKFAVNSPQWLATFPDFTAQQNEISGILQQAGH